MQGPRCDRIGWLYLVDSHQPCANGSTPVMMTINDVKAHSAWYPIDANPSLTSIQRDGATPSHLNFLSSQLPVARSSAGCLRHFASPSPHWCSPVGIGILQLNHVPSTPYSVPSTYVQYGHWSQGSTPESPAVCLPMTQMAASATPLSGRGGTYHIDR